MSESELDVLLARSLELGERFTDPEALEVNEAILDLVPGHPQATCRLAIGLLKSSRPADAIPVLENGLLMHPGHSIMTKRLEEAAYALANAVKGKAAGGSAAASGPWSDFDPAHLVARSFSGPGRDDCVRLCAASIRASEQIDAQWTAVTPIKSGYRFRVIGGIFTGVGPWKDQLTVAVPVARRKLIDLVSDVGGETYVPAKAIPCVQLGIPRPKVADVFDELLEAHVEHLRFSLAYGPPTHLNKHHPGLRQFLLDEADRISDGT